MKSNRTMTLFLGLAVLGFTASSLRGAEKAEVEGSFTLPSQTYWGSVRLAPGDYSFTLDHSDLRGRITVRQGTKAVAIFMVEGPTITGSREGSSMLIVDHSVRSLRLAPIGLTYTYPIQKQTRDLLARRPGVPGVSVSVAIVSAHRR
jgi:hypothetical protein